MAVNIEKFAPQTGRIVMENNTTINVGDILDSVYDSNDNTISMKVGNTASDPVKTRLENVAKGDVITVIPAGTADDTLSSEFDTSGFNALKVFLYITGTGTWKVKVQDASESGGTFVDSYDSQGNLMESPEVTASASFLFVGISDQCKIYADETLTGATCKVDVVPMNV